MLRVQIIVWNVYNFMKKFMTQIGVYFVQRGWRTHYTGVIYGTWRNIFGYRFFPRKWSKIWITSASLDSKLISKWLKYFQERTYFWERTIFVSIRKNEELTLILQDLFRFGGNINNPNGGRIFEIGHIALGISNDISTNRNEKFVFWTLM